ncbi:4-aminobutyrate--2-oxoglutarate transaminase [Marinococcus halophilus]|uniref:(S)-3-amino-2-methylpropionate transaminase n=1 Tax=Marinococcus halophilus TaxID=1371 RepID=A0A510Y6R7_MARHA|nr:4-aminobutyrate--2-oxoglutarate transaminase [Marinococcus halophilus]OZT79689.1 4-aminobutyrate--2-oxoglutarate transaminase [Marinococcus halophilus]GEK59045.1 putative 4-aminobutyrate aminotransferase [Marinococcus halophilus]
MKALHQTWQEKRDQYVPKSIGNGNRSIAASGQGATIIDENGAEFIDFAGAIGTMNVGHSHPKVVEAAKKQMDKITHPGFNVIMYDSYIELAARLSNLAPGAEAKKTALFNSGAEAVENAVKIARKATGRSGVLTFERGFHGRTNMTMAMTAKVKPYKHKFGPFSPEVYHAPYPYMFRRPASMTEREYEQHVIEELDLFLKTEVAPDELACIVMEPVQGEGGFIVPPASFVRYVAELCRDHGILFVSDEIQAGFARTGKWFAIEHFGVEPDLITVSKSLAAGFPLSGVIGKAEVMDAAGPGEIGGTYCGNPVACEAALAVINIIESERLNERAEWLGAKWEQYAGEWEKSYSWIRGHRRLGAMAAFEIVKADGLTPDPEKTARVTKKANEHGLLLLSAGVHGNVIRFLAPIVITEVELSKGVEKLEFVLKEIEGEVI